MGRTQRFFRFRTLENLHKSRLFRVERSTKRFRFRESHLRPLGQPSKLYLHPIRFGKWGELMGRTQRFFRFRTLENLHKSRLFRVERSTKRFRFRDRPVMTASIPLRMKFSGRRDRGGLRKVEAPSRFELEQSGICSPLPYHLAMAPYGAGNEIRTRYLHLGKVALCQMSYARKWCLRPELNWRHADFQSAALPTELPRQMACFERRDMVGTTGLEPVTPCL